SFSLSQICHVLGCSSGNSSTIKVNSSTEVQASTPNAGSINETYTICGLGVFSKLVGLGIGVVMASSRKYWISIVPTAPTKRLGASASKLNIAIPSPLSSQTG